MGDTKTHILIVDDDPSITELVRYSLRKEGFAVTAASYAEEALALVKCNQYDLFILDIMLPDASGLKLCQRIRAFSLKPVLFLSACDDEMDKVIGLEVGGDDYLTKPFGVRELIARVRALLRRFSSANAHHHANLITAGGITINETNHTVTGRNGEIVLTPREFELLSHLIKNTGKAVSREDLLRSVWGWDYFKDTKTVDVYIKRLRKKIETTGHPSSVIATVRGVGYKIIR